MDANTYIDKIEIKDINVYVKTIEEHDIHKNNKKKKLFNKSIKIMKNEDKTWLRKNIIQNI